MFLVDRDTPGFTVERHVEVIRPQYSTEILLDNAEVPDSQVLGQVGFGFNLFQEWANHGRVMMAASCLGRCERAFKLAVEHAKQRVTFGQPLSKRQAIQWMMVDSAMEIKQDLVDDAGMRLEIDQENGYPKRNGHAEAFCNRNGLPCLGPGHPGPWRHGPDQGAALERWFREVRVMRIVEGASEIQRFVLGRNIFRD